MRGPQNDAGRGKSMCMKKTQDDAGRMVNMQMDHRMMQDFNEVGLTVCT